MKKLGIVFVLLVSMTISAQEKFDVFFDFNKDAPNEREMAAFQDWMKTHQNFKVIKLSGFCDSIDNSSYNKELSSRRITTVLKILAVNQFPISEKVALFPMGENFKMAKIQAENRKVEILAEAIPVKVEIVQPLSVQVKDAQIGDKIKLKNINFFNNSDILVNKSKPILEELLCILQDNPTLKIEIQGHICCRIAGDITDVSTARAKAVWMYLIRKKINRNRLTFKGYGGSQPKFPIPERNEDEENENRRVEIKIVAK